MLEVGQELDGKYTIVRLIGQGGMGAVYEGINRLIDRRVAIKVLLPSADPNAVRRFEQEARAAGRIGNDHILEVLDLGAAPDGSHYMVTEFLDGQPLDELIETRGRVDLDELIPLAQQLLSGLGAAHAAGVIHRDLKPDNIFVVKEKAGRRDFVKIIDFGISKFSQVDSDSMSMTRTGSVMGTPFFMAPEQARGVSAIDHRTDLYAVGVILYNAVCGQLPYQANSLNELLFKVALEKPLPLGSLAPTLQPEFVQLVEKAMARDPADRFQSAEEFRQALSEVRQEGGVPTPGAAVLPPSVQSAREVSSAQTYPDELGPRLTPSPFSGGHSVPTPGPFSGTRPELAGLEQLPRKKSAAPLLIGFFGLVMAGGVLAFTLGTSGGGEPEETETEAGRPTPETPLTQESVVAPEESDARAEADSVEKPVEDLLDRSKGDSSAKVPSTASRPKPPVKASPSAAAPSTAPTTPAPSTPAAPSTPPRSGPELEEEVYVPPPRPAPVARPAPAPRPAPTPRPAPAPRKKKSNDFNFGY